MDNVVKVKAKAQNVKSTLKRQLIITKPKQNPVDVIS